MNKIILFAICFSFYCQSTLSQNDKEIDYYGKMIYTTIAAKDSLKLIKEFADYPIVVQYIDQFACDSLTKQNFKNSSTKRIPKMIERMKNMMNRIHNSAEGLGIIWNQTKYLGVEVLKRPDFKTDKIDAMKVVIRFLFKNDEYSLETSFLTLNEKIYIADRILLTSENYR